MCVRVIFVISPLMFEKITLSPMINGLRVTRMSQATTPLIGLCKAQPRATVSKPAIKPTSPHLP